MNYHTLYLENISINEILKYQKIENDTLKTKLSDGTKKINNLSNLLNHNQEKLSNKIQELNSIYSSFSWKIIQKLRYVKKLFLIF